MTTKHVLVTVDSNDLSTVTGGRDDARNPAGQFENPPGMIGQKRKPQAVWKSRNPRDAWDNLIFR